MRIVRIGYLGLTALALLSGTALAALGQAESASVTFTALGPAGLRIEGKTSELDVKETEGVVTIGVPLAHLDTGISLRNKHMREKYLEVDKYPRAELTVNRTELKLPLGGGDTAGRIPGTMTIHGKTRPVTVDFTAKSSGGGKYAVVGSTHIDVKEYGIDVPSYLGVTVKPGVDLNVGFTATDK